MESDEELVEEYQGGRREAFDDLMNRHMGAIFNLGSRMCHRLEDAEDLVQNTFLNAHRYLPSFRGRPSSGTGSSRSPSTAACG